MQKTLITLIFVGMAGVSLAQIPMVELRSSDCGVDDFHTNDIIRSTSPPSGTAVTAYEWRFVELEAPFETYEVLSPNGTNPNFRLKWFIGVKYGMSYDVSVRIYENGLPGSYGNVCDIALQTNVLTTQLQTQYQNSLVGFCNVIGANSVGASEQYRWTFNDFDNPLFVAFGDGSSRFLRMYDVPGISLGQTYIVNVYATVNGVESPQGPSRFITLNNFVPNTGLNQALYPCGATYPINTQVQAVEICRAQSYTWRFRNTSQVQADLFYTRSDGNRFIRLDWLPALIEGDNYNVDVRAQQGGLMGDYSSICNITIAGPSGLMPENITIEEEGIVFESIMDSSEPMLEMDAVQMAGSGSNIMISIINPTSENQVQLALFDLNGRLVDQKMTSVAGQSSLTWDTGALTTGIYILKATNGAQVSTRKITLF